MNGEAREGGLGHPKRLNFLNLEFGIYLRFGIWNLEFPELRSGFVLAPGRVYHEHAVTNGRDL